MPENTVTGAPDGPPEDLVARLGDVELTLDPSGTPQYSREFEGIVLTFPGSDDGLQICGPFAAIYRLIVIAEIQLRGYSE